MKPNTRSALLQKPLPPELADGLAGAENAPWLSTDSDVDLSGRYARVFLLVWADELRVVGDGEDKSLRRCIHRKDISEIRTRQGVGGGFLQAMVEGVWVDVIAYSNAKADVFHKVSAKLGKWLKGQPPELSAEDDADPRRCGKCGLALQFKGDVCRRCVNRGAVFLRVLKLMRPYWWRALIMVGLVVAGIVLSTIPMQINREITDRLLVPALSGKGHELALATSMLAMFVGAILLTRLIEGAVHMVDARLASYVATQITYDVRKKVFDHLTQLSVDYFDRYNVGQLISRVSGDTEQLRGFVHQITHGFLRDTVMIVVVGSILFGMDWRLALLTMLPAPLVILGVMLFWKRVYPRYYRVWDANSRLSGTLNTILSGVRVVKAFAQEPREQDRFERSAGYVRDSFRNVEYVGAVFHPSIGFVFQIGGMLVWFFGGMAVLKGEVSLGTLQAFLGYLWMFYQPLGSLAQVTNWLTGFLTASQRTFEILDTPVQIAEHAAPVAVRQMAGSIVFDGVKFGYDRHHPVLKGISFEIKPGEKIGVVGKSGSGKTTIINLISRFYDVDDGKVLIDGVDIQQVCKDDLRRQVGVVLQEPFLFRGTIYDNITYGARDATPEMVMAAAKAANCHDFIMRHPLGYDTYVGERGSGLSGGERQRISIARALLYDPRVLILDEATSSVDTESEKLIQDALKKITADRTTIAIAHRLSTLKNSDRIFVVDGGRVAEQGTHEELMAAKGTYYTLVKIQTELSTDRTIDQLAAAGN